MIPLEKVPLNKRLLWFFDDEMTHDLVFIPSGIAHNNRYTDPNENSFDKIMLVERFTVYGYPPRSGWIENLFNALLPHSELIKPIGPTFSANPIPTKKYTFTIPASPLNIGKRIVLAYYIPHTEIRSNRLVIICSLHYKYFTLTDSVQEAEVHCAKGSAHVLTDVKSVEQDVNNQLKDTIEFEYFDEAKTLITTTRKTEFPENPTCTAIAWGYYSWIEKTLLFVGELHTTPTVQITKTHASYPMQGALIYAHPECYDPTNKKSTFSDITVGDVDLFDVDYSYVLAEYNSLQNPESIIEPLGGKNLTNYNYTIAENYLKRFCVGVQTVSYYIQSDYVSHTPEFYPALILCNYIVGALITEIAPEIDYLPTGWTSEKIIGNLHAPCVINYDTTEKEILTVPLTFIKKPINNWLEKQEKYHLRKENLTKNHLFINLIKNKFLPIIKEDDFNDWLDEINYNDFSLRAFVDDTLVFYPTIPFIDYAELIRTSNYGVTKILQISLDTSFKVVYDYHYRDYPAKVISVVNAYYIPEEIDYTSYIKTYITEMNTNLLIQEIHACLGAGEFAYYEDSNGEQQAYYMNMARLLTTLSRSYGVAFNPDGSILEVRQRVKVPYKKIGNDYIATIPDGYLRGQFADNKGGNQDVNKGQIGGKDDEERTGIAYQNRCNILEKWDDADPDNNEITRGHVILCENFLQLFESYLEDLDKGLNWQEMGSAVLPNADGSGYCTFEGMGTLLAEVAYMLSSLSKNIYETHNLSLMSYNNTLELLKGLGVPVIHKTLKIETGEEDSLTKEPVMANMILPAIAPDSDSISQQLFRILHNVALLLGLLIQEKKNEETTN